MTNPFISRATSQIYSPSDSNLTFASPSIQAIGERLWRLGGVPYLVAREQFESDPDLRLISIRGKPISIRGKPYSKVAKRYTGPDGQCHWNVANLYSAGMSLLSA